MSKLTQEKLEFIMRDLNQTPEEFSVFMGGLTPEEREAILIELLEAKMSEYLEGREAKNRRNWWNKILAIFFVCPVVFSITFGVSLLVCTKVFKQESVGGAFFASAGVAAYCVYLAYTEFLSVMKDEN